MYGTRSLPNVGVIGIPAARQVHLVYIRVRQHFYNQHELKSEHLEHTDFWSFNRIVSNEDLKRRRAVLRAQVAPDGRCSYFA